LTQRGRTAKMNKPLINLSNMWPEMLKKNVILWMCLVFVGSMIFPVSPLYSSEKTKSGCKSGKTTICTIEMWLGHVHKKNKKLIRADLKSKSLKVLRHTVQYLKRTGGHPPTNIAIGSKISAEDARLAIALAEHYNDRIDRLIVQALNPPNYVAIATSAWDDKSEVRVTQDQLAALKDPKLSTEEFHTLYRKLTDEANRAEAFY